MAVVSLSQLKSYFNRLDKPTEAQYVDLIDTLDSSGWSLTGDAGTNATTDFIGTTDNVSFIIRTNNLERVRVTNGGLFGIGVTPTEKLHVVGSIRMVDTNEGLNKVMTSDANGVASWQTPSAGWLLTGNAGTTPGTDFIGTTDNIPLTIKVNNQQAVKLTSTGATLLGYQAGNVNTEATTTAVGHNALIANTTGAGNVATGWKSLNKNTVGYENNAFGWAALFNTVGGYRNTSIGHGSSYNNTSGYENTAVGVRAFDTHSTGYKNTIIGANADILTNGLFNATAIGANAVVSASNNMMFGDTAVIGWGFGVSPAGTDAIKVGTGVTNGNGATLTVGGIWTDASDRTKKHNIEDISYGLNEVLKLHPVSYKLNDSNKQDIGFIAQEVKEILPEIVYGEEGSMTLSYGQITSVLTKAIQEQQKTINELKERLNLLESK